MVAVVYCGNFEVDFEVVVVVSVILVELCYDEDLEADSGSLCSSMTYNAGHC